MVTCAPFNHLRKLISHSPSFPPTSVQEEQFQKVMHASVLIGVHGAALTNMVWQPPVQSTVIEIGFNPRKVCPCKKEEKTHSVAGRFNRTSSGSQDDVPLSLPSSLIPS
jgi:hypothetical protein